MGAPVDRLLNVLEGWWDGKRPSMREPAVCPTVYLHRAPLLAGGAEAPSLCTEKLCLPIELLSIPRGALGKPVDKTKCQMLDIVSFSFSL